MDSLRSSVLGNGALSQRAADSFTYTNFNWDDYIDFYYDKYYSQELNHYKKSLGSIFLSKRACTQTTRDIHTRASGDEILQTLYECLAKIDSGPTPRANHQRLFHDAMILAMLDLFYGDEFMVKIPELAERFGTVDFRRLIAIACPRRFGKTWSVAMISACVLFSCASVNIACFATGSRIAREILEISKHFLSMFINLRMLNKTREEGTVSNVERISLPNGSSLRCYPESERVRLPPPPSLPPSPIVSSLKLHPMPSFYAWLGHLCPSPNL